MQQQPRRAFTAPQSQVTAVRQPLPQDARSGPVELDLEQLRHVAGGEETPKKYW